MASSSSEALFSTSPLSLAVLDWPAAVRMVASSTRAPKEPTVVEPGAYPVLTMGGWMGEWVGA